MFQYSIVNQDSKTIVEFAGDMDIDVTEIMEEDIAPQLMERKDIVFDFSKVSFVDSSGIGLLITLIKNLQSGEKKVVITNLSPEVAQVFDLLQLPEILGQGVFADMD